MKWDEEGGGDSNDVEDRRGQGSGGGSFAGGGGGAGGLGLAFGLFRIFGWRGLLVGAVIGVVLKANLFGMMNGGGATRAVAPPSAGARVAPADEQQSAKFVTWVLNNAQSVWTQEFAARGSAYEKTKLVLFTGATRSGCGGADAASGPFYCPADRKVYIDLGFYAELKRRFGAPGDFAQAYVIAHEIGHHVQNLLGTEAKMRAAQRARPREENQLSVRMELQADCYAGIWGKHNEQRLEQGDVQEALTAATAIGDDRLQKQAGQRVNPEGWTHGSSAQRVAWFTQGMRTGKMEACDTFNLPDPK